MKEFNKKMFRRYGGNKVRRDGLGRPIVPPAQVQREMRPKNDFEAQERFYPPTAKDIQIKMEGLNE